MNKDRIRTNHNLNDKELAAALAALYAYRSETTRYLRFYEQPDGGYDDCCDFARARAARRREEREALNVQLRNIDGAILALDPEAT